jgi:hypothetical protein
LINEGIREIRSVNLGGWIVIEDISLHALPLWQVVGAILPPAFCTSIVQTREDWLMFTVNRIS